MVFLDEHFECVGMRVGRKQRPKTQKQRGHPPPSPQNVAVFPYTIMSYYHLWKA